MSEERETLEPPPEPDFVDRYAEPARAKFGPHHRPKGRRPSLFGPLLLIVIGVLLLLDQFGRLDLNLWALVSRYWPVLLILGGLDLLLGRRSVLGGLLGFLIPLFLIAGVFWLVFGGLPGWVSLDDDAAISRERIEHRLGELTEADVFLDLGSWHTVIRAVDNTDYLLEGEISTYGTVEFSASERDSHADLQLSTRAPSRTDLFRWPSGRDDDWWIRLSSEVTLDLELDCGSGGGEYDLRDLDLRALVLDGGSGSFDLLLPAGRRMDVVLDVGSGSVQLVLPARGDIDLEIDGGTGGIVIELPDEMAMRVVIDAGSGAFHPSERFELVEGELDGDGVWETASYERAENRVEMRIEQGSGAIRIEDL